MSTLQQSNTVKKRPLDDKETFEVSSKHSRLIEEHGNQLFSSLESGFSEDASLVPHISGGTEVTRGDTEGDGKLVSGILVEHKGNAEDVQSSGPGCVSISSLPTSSTSEEDSRPGTPFHEPLYWEYLFPDRRTRQLYTLLMSYPPQKPVPIGEDHQVDIPAWDPQCAEETSNHTCRCEVAVGFEHNNRNECEKFLMGTCVIPMPDLGTPDSDGKVGNGRADCPCEDRGSVRCVRQHIAEAREELRDHLGQERYADLGFLNMGEVVADKWSDEEQKLFHKIVYSNPVSLGRRFWDILYAAFPSRTKRDIVSYYFNVFMLRKRALQNRCPAMNIDSDNDEWQGSDDSGDNEIGTSDEDEDSVIETPAYNEGICYNWCPESGLHVYEEDTTDGTDNQKLQNGSSPDPSFQPQDEKGDLAVQDDSCASSDTGPALQVKAENEDQWHGSLSTRNTSVHEYLWEPTSAKVWDAGYPSYQNKVDLLPTCSMIKEVFGDGKSSVGP